MVVIGCPPHPIAAFFYSFFENANKEKIANKKESSTN
jgi:hypothetical protein